MVNGWQADFEHLGFGSRGFEIWVFGMSEVSCILRYNLGDVSAVQANEKIGV